MTNSAVLPFALDTVNILRGVLMGHEVPYEQGIVCSYLCDRSHPKAGASEKAGLTFAGSTPQDLKS